jgi:hypothetical protein
MAKAIGISVGSVQRIWRAHKLQPHRLRTFKRSRDPGFAAKLTDIVGLYVDPPAHAVVLSIDAKSQIQALDRTQPGLPIKPGRCQTLFAEAPRVAASVAAAIAHAPQANARDIEAGAAEFDVFHAGAFTPGTAV